MSASLTAVDAGRAELSGDLLSSTVAALMKPGRRMIAAASGEWVVDMSRVNRVSSAGVALLLDWMRAAEAAQIALRVANMPPHMLPIIAISDLEPLFETVISPAG